MKYDIDLILLSSKIAIFTFIITSPFYNVAETFAFANNIIVKVLFLALIVGVTFIDLQLAILLAIAFFILMMNLNNNVVINATAPAPAYAYAHSPAAYSDAVTPYFDSEDDGSFGASITVPPVPLPPDHIPETNSEHVMQTMYEFPPAQCDTPHEANDSYMNETIMTYYLDEKIKPYEDFISQLTNEELLDAVSNGAYIGA
jgi:hypothetical protein